MQNILKNISVLYIEDEKVTRTLVSEILALRVKELFLATNGKEGLEVFFEKNPDIIVTDIQMPKMTGLEFAREVKQKYQHTPIIVTTAYSDIEFLIEAIDLGIDSYVFKPVDIKKLIDKIETNAKILLRKRELEEQRKNIEFILDLNPALMCLFNEQGVEYINKTSLEAFGFEDFNSYLESKYSLCDFLFDEQGVKVFNSDKEIIKYIKSKSEQKIIYIKNIDENSLKHSKVFLLSYNYNDEKNKFIVTFIDVSLLENQKKSFQEMALHDSLTKIANRLKFKIMLENQIKQFYRYNFPFSLIFFDIDYFKKINDSFGHQVGDEVLKDLTKVVSLVIRDSDIFARWGGEEFVVLALKTKLREAYLVAEKIRCKINNSKFKMVGSLSCSFGVTLYKDGESKLEFIERADKALYKAKNAGRNRVEVLK